MPEVEWEWRRRAEGRVVRVVALHDETLASLVGHREGVLCLVDMSPDRWNL